MDDFYKQKVKSLIDDLKNEFRRLLGVEFYDNE